ncbi:MAG: RagB/SusD family nutrient uptake outer membrane protein [Bacteroidia bacterium]|nr:RagB/SusD family nutrient uptake outer membrane protein [Bacteroidia bacterium]
MNLKYIFTILTSVFLLFTACNDWFDVQPKSLTSEEKLFSRADGFKESLTGVYMQLSSPNLYGKTLMYDYLDELAMLRHLASDNRNIYDFKPENNSTSAIFRSMYIAISNTNALISWIEKKPEVLAPELKNIIEGEAYGLRGFIYFDLLRMFGPILSVDPTKTAVPYRTQVEPAAKKPATAKELIESIIADLLKAETLLKDDPMNIAFPPGAVASAKSDFLSHRNNRMNKFAVKALLARVYLYKGDKTNAAKYAQEVIDAKNKDNNVLFDFVEENSNDPILSNELIFSLNVTEGGEKAFEDMVKKDFSLSAQQDGVYSKFMIEITLLDKIFNVIQDGRNDIRIAAGKGFEVSSKNAVSMKFRQTNLKSYALRSTVPVIRLPEMYYILAECTTDMAKASRLLSQVRSARGLNSLPVFTTSQARDEMLDIEYRKEFYGEGQYWYFLKRNFKKKWITYTFEQEMVHENYIFALPTNEIQYK